MQRLTPRGAPCQPLAPPRPQIRYRIQRQRALWRVRSYDVEQAIAELLADEEWEWEQARRDGPAEVKREGPPRKKKYDFADRQDIWPTAEDDDGMVELPPVNPGPDPTKGPLEKQVSLSYRDAMLKNTIDPEHMNYWFTKPRGGWNTKPRRLERGEELPGFFATAVHSGINRRPLSQLKAGDRLEGEVTEIWYYHGIKVDIGYEYDGLLPMKKESWDRFDYELEIGDRLDVEVAKIWNQDFYRWPIQLKAANPKLQRFIIPASRWDPPVDMRGKTVEEIERHTNRRLPTKRYFAPDDPEKAANPYHNAASSLPTPEEEALDPEEWMEIIEDYYDDMHDAACNLGDYNF